MKGIRGQLVLEDRVVAGGLRWEGGRLTEVGPEVHGPDVEDLGDVWIFPGWVDVHVHGGGGADVMDASPEAVRRVLATCAAGGATGVVATTLTAPEEHILAAIRAVRTVAEDPEPDGARVLGLHLEGPYISPKRCGAQDPRYVRDPDLQEMTRLLEAGAGLVRLMTLAPERPRAREAMLLLRRWGAVPSVGHTDATAAEVRAAVLWGARHATHCYNAMRPLHHREPGTVGAVLDADALMCELIADLIHVDAVALHLAWRAKGTGGVLLVTDAMRAAGLGDGVYRLGDLEVTVAEGAARLADGSLAGSTLSLCRAVRNMVEVVGVPLPEVGRMVALNPALQLGLAHRRGRLLPGYDADLTVVDSRRFTVRRTIVAGRTVYREE